MGANAGAQVVHPQINGAQLGKPVQALLRRLVHVARTDGRHHGQSPHGVQPGADDTPVDTVVGVVANQLGAHVDTCAHPLGQHAGDLQAQHTVEHNFVFKDIAQPGNKFRLEHNRGNGFGGHGFLSLGTP